MEVKTDSLFFKNVAMGTILPSLTAGVRELTADDEARVFVAALCSEALRMGGSVAPGIAALWAGVMLMTGRVEGFGRYCMLPLSGWNSMVADANGASDGFELSASGRLLGAFDALMERAQKVGSKGLVLAQQSYVDSLPKAPAGLFSELDEPLSTGFSMVEAATRFSAVSSLGASFDEPVALAAVRCFLLFLDGSGSTGGRYAVARLAKEWEGGADTRARINWSKGLPFPTRALREDVSSSVSGMILSPMSFSKMARRVAVAVDEKALADNLAHVRATRWLASI